MSFKYGDEIYLSYNDPEERRFLFLGEKVIHGERHYSLIVVKSTSSIWEPIGKLVDLSSAKVEIGGMILEWKKYTPKSKSHKLTKIFK